MSCPRIWITEFLMMLVLLVGCLTPVPLFAQTELEVNPDASARHARMLTLAKSYTFSDKTGTASLHEVPLFSWANPDRQATGGELYLWTLQGRPLATMGVWTEGTKDVHEFQSLSSESLTAVKDSQPDWAPRVGGLVWKALGDAAVPENSAVRRMVQMRTIVRERFSAEIKKRGSPQFAKLRLLPQPIYRYDPLPPNVLDGAVFVFAVGTDPEVFVLIEARVEQAGPVWYYAFAPSTAVEVHGFLDEEKIWDGNKRWSNGTFIQRL